MRVLLSILAAAVLAVLVVVGLSQAGGGSRTSEPARPARAERFDLARARLRLAGAPPELAALHAQASELLGGGRPAFIARLQELRGHPVVVNKWASWCGPCRAEFPAFQALATERGRQVAFVGVNSSDKRPAALRFLRDFPVPYPSYDDPHEALARWVDAPANYPITVFINVRGKIAFIHQGGYRSKTDLAADVDRYLQ